MKENENVLEWLNTAVSGIKFGLDRDKVRKELREHIEDKAADLMRIFPDMTEEEAQERALSGMGEAEELKVSLARVHRPWLGRLWMASLVTVICALFLFVSGIYSNRWEFGQERQQRDSFEGYCEALYGDDLDGWAGERLAVYAPGVQARMGRATVSVPMATRRRWDDGEVSLYLRVRITWDRPWERAELEYVSPLKNFLVNGEEYAVAGSARGWNWMEGNLWLYEGEAREAEQVTLTYPPRGDFQLTVDLSREVEP